MGHKGSWDASLLSRTRCRLAIASRSHRTYLAFPGWKISRRSESEGTETLLVVSVTLVWCVPRQVKSTSAFLAPWRGARDRSAMWDELEEDSEE
ncbi:hypothetical protein ACVXG9_22370 [Escherichia coli]